MNAPYKIRPLTALRAIAALLVFLSHYSGLHYERAAQVWQSILIEGHAGVIIFFVLSAFLITLRYLPDIQARRISTYDYFLKRAARILPLYWVVLGADLYHRATHTVSVIRAAAARPAGNDDSLCRHQFCQRLML